MANVPNAVEKLPKVTTAHEQGARALQTDDRRQGLSNEPSTKILRRPQLPQNGDQNA